MEPSLDDYGYQSGQFNRLSSTDSATYQFDANGNTSQKTEGLDSWQYTWDHENRMTTATVGTDSAVYTYDALGRRVRRNVGGGIQDTKFIHGGHDVLVDDDVGTLTKYVNGPGIDNKLRVQQGSTVNYFLGDHLGSTKALTDASGAITSQTAYDSFGNLTASISTRYGFTGRERDDFIRLTYYRARFYDPNAGRFVSEDPIGFDGGDVNLYGYVWNNPLRLIDPEGLNPIIRLGRRIFKNGRPYIFATKKRLTVKQAQNVRRLEGQVFTNDARVARQIEDGAFPESDLMKHPAHGDNPMFRPHYQTKGKEGHTFFGLTAAGAGILAPNTMELSEYACTNGQFASAILWDTASLLDPIGVTDSINAFTGLDGGRGGIAGLADFGLDGAAMAGPMPLPYEYLKGLY